MDDAATAGAGWKGAAVTRPLVLVPVAVAAVASVVFAMGAALVEGEALRAVGVGVLSGAVAQLLLFAIAATAFSSQRLLAYGLGMLGRMLLVVVAALLVVPATGLPAGPFLLSLVTVLFATTVLEPVLWRPANGSKV